MKKQVYGYNNNNKKNTKKVVDLWGFEPQLTEPKSAVLPLHHRSVFAQ